MSNTSCVILLTACINPNGMSFTQLQDGHVRKIQYLEALNYYLSSTSFRIVFCENSGEDLFELERVVNNPRVEFLSFQGNDYDKNLGKGFGEFGIVQYAFQHSAFINEAATIIKITGRLIINNILEIVRIQKLLFGNPKRYVYVEDLKDTFSFDSRCFIASKGFFVNGFLALQNTINDSAGYYFEHFLYDSVKSLPVGYVISDFALPFNYSGISGSTGEEYESEILSHGKKLTLIRDFCQYKKRFYRDKNRKIFFRLCVISSFIRLYKHFVR